MEDVKHGEKTCSESWVREGDGGGHGCRLSRQAAGASVRGCFMCLKLMEDEGRSSERPLAGRSFSNAASGLQPFLDAAV